MRRTSRTLLAILIAMGPVASVQAQPCKEEDTFLACWQRYAPEPIADPTAQPGDVRGALNEIETGADAGTGTASSLKSFLPLLRIAGLAGSGDSQADGSLVTVDLNFLIPGLRDNGQLQAVLNTDPKIHEQLATALQAFDPNSDPEKLIGRNVSDADDYSLVFTYGLSSKTRGRNLETHRARFENLLRAAIRSATQTESPAESFGALTSQFQDSSLDVLTEDQNSNLQSVKFSDISDAAKRAALMNAFERFAADSAATEQAVQRNATTLGIRDFAKLLSNQPQLHASLRRHIRESIVGPDAVSIGLTYELGFVNLNSFDAETGTTCAQADKSGADLTQDTVLEEVRACGVAIRNYMDREDIRAALEHGDRVSFSLSYSKMDEMDFVLPNSMFDFHADGSKKVTAAVAYGRLFGLKGGAADTRIDLEAKYEDASDDETRNDRFVATLTVTKKVGNLSIPFSLVYSNRPEFVAQTDGKFGAHIGVIFDTFPDAK